MSRVIVLRPEPGASETLKRAKACGLDAMSIPLFVVEPMDWQAPEPAGFDAILLTSANAVRTAGEHLMDYRGLPAYAVGRATADAAREAGFDIAGSGDAGVERLLGSLEAELKLLHLCGKHRADAPDVRQKVIAVPVYCSRAIEPAPDIRQAAGAVALVHSPRSGTRFAEIIEKQQVDRSQVAIAAVSAAAAEAAGSGWKAIELADQPTDDALLALARRLCDNPPQG